MDHHRIYKTREYYYLVNGGMPGYCSSTEYDAMMGDILDITGVLISEVEWHITPELELEPCPSADAIMARVESGKMRREIETELRDMVTRWPRDMRRSDFGIYLSCECPSDWLITVTVWPHYRDMVTDVYAGDDSLVDIDIRERALCE